MCSGFFLNEWDQKVGPKITADTVRIPPQLPDDIGLLARFWPNLDRARASRIQVTIAVFNIQVGGVLSRHILDLFSTFAPRIQNTHPQRGILVLFVPD